MTVPSGLVGDRAAQHDVKILRDLRIPTADPAVTLGADVYLPANVGPVPALLTVLPYVKDGAAGVGGWGSHHWFAARGYACVLVDFRGTGSSDGDPRPPFDPDEVDDALDAITWLASQEWCDGNVGMWGVSYGGVMSYRTAARRPPGLKAIIPVHGMLDPETDFVHPAGLPGAMASLGLWGLATLQSALLPPLGIADARAQERWTSRLEKLQPYLLDLHATAPGRPEWRDRRIDASKIDVPTLCVLGWRDLFGEASARAFDLVQGPKRLVAGPWMHTLPQDSPFAAVDFHQLALPWWDRWLKGIDNGTDSAPQVVYVQGASERWITTPTWPPDTTDFELTFESSHQAVHADRTVGSQSGLWALPTIGFGLPEDQHDDDQRATTLTSAPLAEDTLIAGRPEVVISSGGDLVVKLTHVDPNGRSLLITSGAATKGHDATTETAPRKLRLASTCYQVPAGHRLRVVLSSRDFPRFWPNDGHMPAPKVLTTLVLPVRSAGLDPEANLPTPNPGALPAPLGLRGAAQWRVERERLTDTITLTLSTDTAAYTPERQRVLEAAASVSFSCSRLNPNATELRGTATTRITAEPAEPITVDATTHISTTTLTIHGRVTAGDRIIFDRDWTA